MAADRAVGVTAGYMSAWGEDQEGRLVGKRCRRGVWWRPDRPTVQTGSWVPAKWFLERAPLLPSEPVRTHESQEHGAWWRTSCAHPHI